jgi:hypothetical protein
MRLSSAVLFRWRPSPDTAFAALAGGLCIALSLIMIPLGSSSLAATVVRDLGQIFLFGVLLPLAWLRRRGDDPARFGLHLRRWPALLAVDLGLALLLLHRLRTASPPPPGFRIDAEFIAGAAYVMVALTFELLFFYAFLRTLFEDAFGALAGVLLTAAFYALHHAGFQPEFGKLFFVGILYGAVYRLGSGWLCIYPFFLGVGGIYDVLIKSRVVAPIVYPAPRAVLLAAAIAAAVLWYTAGRSLPTLCRKASAARRRSVRSI